MKKITPNPPETSMDSDSLKLFEATERATSKRLRNPTHADPVSHVFTILPNIDTESLLSHACETLASLNVLTTDLACKLEGSNRSLALSIQQLAVIGELLINRALDNLDPPEGVSEVPSASQA
ncbi:DUF6124 family protein [Pseudomonas sp. C9]|jgi:hypothetical protein|uniref:DUF6124 family protein n=1 Tax=Pseudomonas sp. C9 TaxID=1311337 RepID=UPI00098602C1|nr:DUF6124 family protein [Pseudomonas sp. C9]OOG11427.1 hypothetical protein BMS17_04770 [Pseudomonas sp. C9]